MQSSLKSPDPVSLQRNKRAGIAMMLIFLAPVVVAYILLKTGVYQDFGTANNGTLLDPPNNILDNDWSTDQTDAKSVLLTPAILGTHWWFAYEMPNLCETKCQQRLLQIRQTLLTLGPYQHRVRPLILVNDASDLTSLQLWQDQLQQKNIETLVIHTKEASLHSAPGIQEALLSNGSVNTLENTNESHSAKLQPGGLYIVDPKGFVMLYYAPVAKEAEAITQAKSLIKDLKYLLKVSRIG